MRHVVMSIACAAWAAATLGATSLLPADTGELSREARAIVVGRVADVSARWAEGRRGIETLVTLEAQTYLKGTLGSTVQFLVPGGELGRFRNIVVGAPQFVAGERVIVFLGARGPGIPYILGFSQGVFRVTAQDGGWVVTPPALIPSGAAAVRIVRGDPARRAMALDEFERQVRQLAAGKPANP